MKARITTKQLVQIALIAAIYAALTAVFMSVSFTALQLRVSEVMVFLAYFNPISVIGLTLGCFIANLLMSPTPLLDCIFGTLATLLSVGAIHLTSRVFKGSKVGMVVASIWPVVFNAVIIGTMLCVAGIVPMEEGSRVATMIATMGSVGFGEMIVVMVMGIPLTYVVMTRYKKVMNYLV
ncbi:MAG: QueT transporter family protein [Cellulosilyticum sp.]|nr:QueT transporter family protein [Cellulosilyticum sp.]